MKSPPLPHICSPTYSLGFIW